MKTSRTKLRHLKNSIKKVFNNIKFKIEAFSFSKIIILLWVVFWFISLFMKYSNNNSDIQNALNNITFFNAIITSIFLFIILFLLFSYNKKEKIKKITSIIFRDYILIIFISIILFILSINNLWLIIWFKSFSSETLYVNWITMSIISSIFLFVWAILLKNDYLWSNNIYLNDSTEHKIISSEKNNTQLPF